MRHLMVVAAVISALAVAAAQDSPQRFRGGVDLITVDVSAVDSKGKPVEDLKPGDFLVKVDGKPRSIVSAELIKVERGKPAAPVRPVDALITTNASPQNARRIIVAVDQTLITPGSLAPLQKTAREFIGRLAPDDYAAFVAFPEPGPRIDFTTDKTRVQKTMEQIVGQPSRMFSGDFEMSVTDAIDIAEHEIEDKSDPPQPITREKILSGPTMKRVLERGCRQQFIEDLSDGELLQCRRDAASEARTVSGQARIEATISLKALERLLRDLVPLEGPKSMVLFSAGLINDNPLLLDEMAQLAAAARTSINVIAVDQDQQRMLGNLGGSGRAIINLSDRSLEMQGLEIIADRTGGSLYKGIAAGNGIFNRIESELSAWYLVAVDRQPGDPERQKLEVEVKRKGVTVRSNKTIVATTFNTKRPVDVLLSDILSSPFAMPGVPLRVSTFAQRDADPGKYRVRLAAQVGAPGEPAGEFGLGYVLADEKGKVLTTAGSRRNLSPAATGPNQSLQYDTVFSVGPGSYLLRFGVVDKDGHSGTVVHRLELPKFEKVDVPTSDLIVGNLPAEGETLTPRVEPQVTTSELAGYLELYLPEDARDVSVSLEIAEGESSPALAASAMTIRPGETAASRVATGFVGIAMSPGRYLARAVVSRNGVALKTLSRPITIVRDPTVVTRATTRPKGVPITPELQYRTGVYIAGVVNGLANVVAQEDFELSKPNRRVTSDLLLVRYPGSVRDLISYRDAAQLNGTAIAGRDERLLDLFVKPTEGRRERARRIMLSADAYVPSVFNPIFVVGFLQSDFQSRFELTVNDAGADWPREVKAVSFVEIGRPTLLRTGAFGDFDAPTRGTAWIEEGTGRILQTELQVGRGKSMPTMVTTFKLDERLQVMVPVEMKTENPDGHAVYSNFRRFEVATDSIVQPPSPAK